MVLLIVGDYRGSLTEMVWLNNCRLDGNSSGFESGISFKSALKGDKTKSVDLNKLDHLEYSTQ